MATASGEPIDGTGFYEVKFHDPDGLVFDITENGWAGNRNDEKTPHSPPDGAARDRGSAD